MKQLTRSQSIAYHLYPGLLITLAFVILGPVAIRYGYPPQFAMLVTIALVAVPVLIIHLLRVRNDEKLTSIYAINGFINKLSIGRLILYSALLVVIAFVLWGATTPLNVLLTKNIFNWLPDWFTVQDFAGYDKDKIRTTLILNLVLNGFLAPFVEELYFRGYLLPRMESWGKWSFAASAIFFSIYHFWQPYLYITLILALLPMTYAVWRTKDIRVGILTHGLLNLIGALLTFALVNRPAQ